MRTRHAIAYTSFIAVLSVILIYGAVSPAEEKTKRGPHIEGGESGIEFMNKFDLNKDGKISHDEWEAVKPGTVYREKHWPEYNTNGDDFITLEEAPEENGESEPAPSVEKKKGPNANQIAFVVKFDKDQDGKLSKEEFTGAHFTVYDRNGDGFIEAEEAPEGQTAY
jgi:Ca2+-binding EF-hand superfamily protein